MRVRFVVPSLLVLLFGLFTAWPSQATCIDGDSRMCLNQERFQVEVEWQDFEGNIGTGQVVPFGSDDSGLFWFFASDNWEMLIKVLDGCSFNQHYWVFSAATTNVEYTLKVNDTERGISRSYFNPLGNSAAAFTDTEAFNTCSNSVANPESPTEKIVNLRDSPQQDNALVRLPATYSSPEKMNPCVSDDTALCLNQERFKVEVDWRDFEGNTGSGQVVPFGSDDSGVFWFFASDNWEMLVKVLDGCSFNQNYWVFSAATTNVEYTLRVTDTERGITRSYFNPLGTSAAALTDTEAFATCGEESGLPPDPGPANDLTLEGIDSDGDGIRDDVQRYIALEYPGQPEMQAALRQVASATQDAIIESDSDPAALDNIERIMRGIECLMSEEEALSSATQLFASVIDTEMRGLAYFDFEERLGGSVIRTRPVEDWSESCSTNITSTSMPRLKTDSCIATETEVFFLNGITTPEIRAELAAGFLSLRMQRVLPADVYRGLTFSVAYNKTDGFWRDVWEAFQQDVNTSWSQFFLYLSGQEAWPDSFRDRFLQIAAGFDELALVDSEDLQEHLRLYRDALFQGKKVLLVAHSQGNYFANQAHANLSADERRSFGIASVANPDDFVGGGGPYTTITEDVFIKYIIDIFVEPLSPNVSNGVGILLNDWSGHGFIEAYLPLGEPSSNKIEQDIVDVLQSLEAPTQIGGDGIITVTLRWGIQPDVDLHVFEPNGEHVYYLNQQGMSGELDVDDVNGEGPENYVAKCDTLESGTYRVGVNYFRGNGPETARVSINAGLQVRNFEVQLFDDLGSSGNNSPIPVANIIVTGNEQEGYEFQIE